MNLMLKRYSVNNESTLGLLFVNDKFFCYTLEDQKQIKKIKGETRIPAGHYDISFLNTITPLTKKYREKYNWFKFHLEIKNVPGFTNVYIHVGNTDDHTDGCLLVGDGVNNNTIKDGFLSNSVDAFKRLYQLLENEKDITLSIYDEDDL